jgi:hypothetical protein
VDCKMLGQGAREGGVIGSHGEYAGNNKNGRPGSHGEVANPGPIPREHDVAGPDRFHTCRNRIGCPES